ncbi:PH domain-containing protein [Chloroflexota bacterium]
MSIKILLYEDTPKYDSWIKFILGGVLALTFILGIIFISLDIEAALVMFGITVFDALLFKIILPRRFQIFEDRLTIVLGGPFSINIPFANIREVKSVSGSKVLVYWGIKFATSTHHVVEIVRKKGLNMIISPSNDDMFLEQFNQAQKLSGNGGI